MELHALRPAQKYPSGKYFVGPGVNVALRVWQGYAERDLVSHGSHEAKPRDSGKEVELLDCDFAVVSVIRLLML